ncbi:MAG: AAA family ATPase [Theionarchaea archaeon]|nr:AAA family ATPase [Theionarchaea archaeon]
MTKARLRIENIGGFRKPLSIEFEKGYLYFIEGSNSSGKTSLIKALAGILSVSPSGQFELKSDRGILEAEHLGIKSSEKNPQEGLVNAHAEFGKIKLEIDGNNYIYHVKKDGTPVVTPENGNELFLLTGVLSNDSRVLRQLNDGIDDFNWIVDDLSLAKRYGEYTDILKTRKEDAERLYTRSKQKKNEVENLEKKLDALKDARSSVGYEMKHMEKQYKEIEDLIKEREEKYSEMENEKNSTREIKRSISQLNTEFERKGEDIAEEEKILKSHQEEYTSIPEIAEMEQALEKLITEAQEKVTKLQTQRERTQGVLDLYLPALNNMRKMNVSQTKCPLCETGSIDSEKLSEKIETLKKEIDNINGRIKQHLMNKDFKKREFQKKKERKEWLRKEIGNIKDELKKLSERIRDLPSRISGEEDRLEKKREKIAKLEEEYEELKKRTEMVDEEASKALDAKEEQKTRINKEIGAAETALEETSIQILDKLVPPEKAERILLILLEKLDFTIQNFSKVANEHRREAAKRFNQNISEMIQKLGFEKLVNIRLNDEYRLYIERIGDNGEEKVIQQIKSLSTSEKLTIALILQSALRNTYLSEIPFFLIDGIIQDFDEDRRREVINYLKQLTAEENIIVIATRLNEELPSIKIQEV